MSNDMSRRSFLKKGTAVAAGLAVAPGIIIAGETPKDNKKKKKVAMILLATIIASIIVLGYMWMYSPM